MRKFSALISAAGVVVALSACSAGPASLDGCTPIITAGSNAALVSADGTFGGDPRATFPTPLVAGSASQLHVVSLGDVNGARATAGMTSSVQVTIYNGKTGDVLISTNYDKSGLLAPVNDSTPAFGSVVQCAQAGSRVAAVGTAGALVGEAAIQQNNLAVAPDDTVVMVVDVQAVYLGRADGADQILQPGFPSIVLAPDGRPGFTFTDPKAPTDLRIHNLKVGTGETVKDGDHVVLNYTGVIWETKAVFDSTWDRSTPAILVASSTADTPDRLVPGFATALIGQRVGSQVIVSIPPQGGYPDGQAPASVPAGSTMVFVFDVLGIQ